MEEDNYQCLGLRLVFIFEVKQRAEAYFRTLYSPVVRHLCGLVARGFAHVMSIRIPTKYKIRPLPLD